MKKNKYTATINDCKKLELNYDDGMLIILDGDIIINKYETVFSIYNMQYNPIINLEKNIIIINSYEKGLACYRLSTGEIIWKINKKKIKEIYEFKNILIYAVENKNIYFVNIENGEQTEIIDCKVDGSVFKISNDEFVYISNYNLYIHNVFLNKCIKKIQLSSININNSLSFVVTECFKKDNILLLGGYEQYKENSNLNKKSYKFKRILDLGEGKIIDESV